MENFYFEGNSIDHDYRPTVDMRADTGYCEFSGLSYPWDPVAFYIPIIRWIKEYITEDNKILTFNMKMDGFNTTSGAKLMEIFRLLENYHTSQRGKAQINWYYEEEDDDILEAGEDFQKMLKVPIDLYVKEEEE